MSKQQVIADEVLDMVAVAIANGEKWMAYNNSIYFLDKEDVCFFKDQESALSFSESNYSDYDNFQVIHVESIADVLKQIPYRTDVLEKQQLDANSKGLYTCEPNSLTDALNSRLEQQQIINSKMNFMNEKNFQYLKDNLKYMGFGENLTDALRENLSMNQPAFILQLDSQINRQPFSAALYFRQGEGSDVYFFNKWQGSLAKGDDKLQQTFYLNRGTGITMKEGFNLLEGRAVYKELTDKEAMKYHAWVQLDMKEKDPNGNYKVNQYHENYGYDLEKALAALPIKELGNADQREALYKSLEKGNLQAATFDAHGFIEKLFVEANPRYKSVNVYDHNGHRLSMDNLEKRFQVSMNQKTGSDVTLMGKAKQGLNGKEQEVSSGKTVSQGQAENEKQSQKKGLGEKKSNDSLLPKKRRATSKGQSLS